MQVDMDRIAGYMREVANARIRPRFESLAAHEISTKSGPSDLVTIADIEAEKDLTRILKDALPGSHVIGEEAVSEGTAHISALREEQDFVWVVDPVDGTNNFAAGKPVFGTIVALVYRGQTVAGWIYDIPGDRMGVAECGAGAAIGGAPCAPDRKPGAPLAEIKGFVSTKFVSKDLRAKVEEKLALFKQTGALFCCAHEYLALAGGKRQFSFYSRIKPWDHLAGVLLFGEAGGYSRKWDKSPYLPGDEEGGLINAANEGLWTEIEQIFLDIRR